MKIARILGAAVITVGLLLPAVPSFAHHSFAAEFDATNCRDFTGTLTKIDWQNPHGYFYMDVKDANGKVESWSFQTANADYRRRTCSRAGQAGHRDCERQHRQGRMGERMSREEWQAELCRIRNTQIFGWHSAPGRPTSRLAQEQ